MPLRAALTGTALAATFLLAVVEPAVAQNVVSDIALAGGGSERVVLTSPENPTAILRIANPLVPAAERSRGPAFAITEFATDSPLEGPVWSEPVSAFRFPMD
jgi:hypothetical protein